MVHSLLARLLHTVPEHNCPTLPVPCWPTLTLFQPQSGLSMATSCTYKCPFSVPMLVLVLVITRE